MRNELEIIARIEKYLMHNMDAQEHEAFANELKSNTQLAKEVNIQNELMKGIERIQLKAEIKKAHFRYHVMKWIVAGAVILTIASLAFFGAHYLKSTERSHLPAMEVVNENVHMDYASVENTSHEMVVSAIDSSLIISERTKKDSLVVPIVKYCDENAALTETAEEIEEATQTSAPKQIETNAWSIAEANVNERVEPEANKYLKPQIFQLNITQPGVVETEDGIVIAYQRNCFLNKAGQPVNDQIKLEVREAIEVTDMMKAGLSTVSDHKALQTAGMFSITASRLGEELSINPALPLAVSVPGNGLHENLMQWDGVVQADGTLDWQNPQEMEQFLTPVEITDLDFYPRDFLGTIPKYGFDNTNKILTDSLYLSYENYNALAESNLNMNVKELLDTSAEDEFDKSRKRFYAAKGYSMKIIEFDSKSSVSATYSIQPSKVFAFWNNDFNNTNLATHEFEARMKYIHSTCNMEILNLYLNNLDKELWRVDEMACNLCSNDQERNVFEDFATKRDGRVWTTDSTIAALNATLKQKEKAFKTKAEIAFAVLQQELNELYRQRNKMNAEEELRIQNAMNEQFSLATQKLYEEMNLKSVPYNLFASTSSVHSATIGSGRVFQNYTDGKSSIYNAYKSAVQASKRNNLKVTRTGWHNIDALFDPIADAFGRLGGKSSKSANRNTGSDFYYDSPELNTIEVFVKNHTMYDKVFVYLIPKNTSNFIRLKQNDKVFSGKYLEELDYDLVVIAHHGDLIYADIEKNMKGGKHTFSALLPRFDDDLKQMLADYYQMLNDDTRNEKQLKVIEVEIEKHAADDKMRRALEPIVFPCREATRSDASFFK